MQADWLWETFLIAAFWWVERFTPLYHMSRIGLMLEPTKEMKWAIR